MIRKGRNNCSRIPLAAAACVILFSGTGQAAPLNFTIVNDPNGATDTPPFIQLLGINNAGTIVGYTGMGTPNPNRGFILTLPNSFTPLNPNINPVTCTACQVQVFGITNAGTTTDGFYTDSMGITHGFIDAGNGPTATTVDGPTGTTPANTQLLGLDHTGGEAAGFFTNGGGLTQAFIDVGGTSSALPFGTNGPVATDNNMATGVNDAGMVVGFDMPSATTSNGFLFNGSVYTTIQFPGSVFTQPLGLSDNGEVVGTYTDAGGVTHGFTYISGNYVSFDAPGAFNMTTANGVNDQGDIVGFFMNANGATVGFEAVPTPEPGSLGLFSIGAVLLAWRMRTRRVSARR
jgi:probable HAF family extracellular repeat protein